MSDIPTHLFREILRRVPADSLFRFRSVCKTWLRIIDDPGFSKLHFNRGMGDNTLLLRNDTGNVFLLPLSSLIYDEDSCDTCVGKGCTEPCCVKLIDATYIQTPVGPRVPNFPVPCCNGMILISTFKRNCVWVIWNPFTGHSLQLPPPPFDGEREYTCSGFGYDEVNDDYKVVGIISDHLYIYSLKSGVWRDIGSFLFYEVPKERNGVYANGALYWFASPRMGWYGNPRMRGSSLIHGYIVSLDLTTETFNQIPLPNEIESDFDYLDPGEEVRTLELVASNGCVFLTYLEYRDLFYVWKITKDGHDESEMIVSFYTHDMCLISYLKNQHKALLFYQKEAFLWYDQKEDSIQEVSVEVNSDANGEDDCEYLCDTFAYQVLPSNLARLKIGDDGPNEGDSSKGTSNKKRKRTGANQRLSLKICYGSIEDCN